MWHIHGRAQVYTLLLLLIFVCSFSPATWGHNPQDIEHVKICTICMCNINKAKYLHIKYNTCHILEIKNIHADKLIHINLERQLAEIAV
jgi:hypothetical protein